MREMIWTNGRGNCLPRSRCGSTTCIRLATTFCRITGTCQLCCRRICARCGKTRVQLFSDVEEVEFLNGSEPQVEIDLVAYADDKLTVAECKSSGKLGRKELNKKCWAAALLRADQLLLATTAESWPDGSRSRIEAAISRFAWHPHSPQIMLITALGSPSAGEEIIAYGQG